MKRHASRSINLVSPAFYFKAHELQFDTVDSHFVSYDIVEVHKPIVH